MYNFATVKGLHNLIIIKKIDNLVVFKIKSSGRLSGTMKAEQITYRAWTDTWDIWREDKKVEISPEEKKWIEENALENINVNGG